MSKENEKWYSKVDKASHSLRKYNEKEKRMKLEKIINLDLVADPKESYWNYTTIGDDFYVYITAYIPPKHREEIVNLRNKNITITLEEHKTPLHVLEDKLRESGFGDQDVELIFENIYNVFPDALVEQDIKNVR